MKTNKENVFVIASVITIIMILITGFLLRTEKYTLFGTAHVIGVETNIFGDKKILERVDSNARHTMYVNNAIVGDTVDIYGYVVTIFKVIPVYKSIVTKIK